MLNVECSRLLLKPKLKNGISAFYQRIKSALLELSNCKSIKQSYFHQSNQPPRGLCFLHKLTLQSHGPEAVNFAIDVVFTAAKANVFHLGAGLHGFRSAFYR